MRSENETGMRSKKTADVRSKNGAGAQLLYQKKEARKKALGRRASLTAEEKKRAEEQILGYLLDSEEYRSASHILTYASYRDEVSTWLLMERALSEGKQVFCPRILERAGEGSLKTMCFYPIASTKELTPGYRGIPEPPPGRPFPPGPCGERPGVWQPGGQERERRALVIVPGVAFDLTGARLGYGGGFYDRFLAGRPELASIALFFSCQRLDKLPREETDIAPGRILTEQGWLAGPKRACRK